VNVGKDAVPLRETPVNQGIREAQTGYAGKERPFYRRRGSIISLIVFLVVCLICVAIAAAVWIVPALLNGSIHF
jgi:cell division septal protein FtsQ